MQPATWHSTRTAYRDVAEWFVRMSADVGARWEQPGLGKWTVRDLVGHTSRALLTVESYLGQGGPDAEVESPSEYLAWRAEARRDAMVTARMRPWVRGAAAGAGGCVILVLLGDCSDRGVSVPPGASDLEPCPIATIEVTSLPQMGEPGCNLHIHSRNDTSAVAPA